MIMPSRMGSVRVGDIGARPLTECYNAVESNSLQTCYEYSNDVFAFAVHMIFQGLHNVTYKFINSTDLEHGGPTILMDEQVDVPYHKSLLIPVVIRNFGF
jgi:hypothetical protein